MNDQDPKPQGASPVKRLDAFLDAAFAFAVSLLVITSGAPPANLEELIAALYRMPAFAVSFALILLFWLGHRDYGRIALGRGAGSTALSLAIVFVVLVYVYPLRLLIESAAFFISGGYLPGKGLITSFGDLTTLYTIYGVGFLVMSLLYLLLLNGAVRRNRKLAPGSILVAEAREWRDIWAITSAAGAASLVAANFGPIAEAPWLPGMVYGVIPIGIGIRALLVTTPKPAPAEAA